MSNNEPPQAPPVNLALTVRAQQGGLVLGFTYPHMQVQVIVPEESVMGLINALKMQFDKIPKVILG